MVFVERLKIPLFPVLGSMWENPCLKELRDDRRHVLLLIRMHNMVNHCSACTIAAYTTYFGTFIVVKCTIHFEYTELFDDNLEPILLIPTVLYEKTRTCRYCGEEDLYMVYSKSFFQCSRCDSCRGEEGGEIEWLLDEQGSFDSGAIPRNFWCCVDN